MPTTNLSVQVRPESDALHRVVALCGRRYLEIIAMSFGGGEIHLTVRHERARSRHVTQWLAALVDVLDVAVLEPSPTASVERSDRPRVGAHAPADSPRRFRR
jgi:acetolactate synthase regulatory subunit